MNCQKCGKHALVHLTEIVPGKNGEKQPVEVHLCLIHAAEAGIIAQSPPDSPEGLSPVQHEPQKALKPMSIMPKEQTEMGLTVSRGAAQADPAGCPGCGMTWQSFKQHGVLGCPQCYDAFEPKLVPLIKRAQEAFSQHAGKVPTRMAAGDPARQVTTARLRRELNQALTQENYEAAAKLRDQLRTLGHN